MDAKTPFSEVFTYNVTMPEPLLQTKLYIPPPRPNLVSRPRLLERLNQGLDRGSKLTLVSAPAGFGKTTLVSKWIATIERPATWISLDEDDNDLTRFLSYFIAALRRIEPGMGEALLELLDSHHFPPLEILLTDLINEICQFPNQFILVLDDFHLLGNQQIHYALAYMLDNLPPPMHLVLASRADPPWSLANMRARGELLEIRSADLRFTKEEATSFLNEGMALRLSVAEIAALEDRTEGWIAGLQLASLSMVRQEDATGFIKAFSGSNRFILEYLVEEVLDRQPAAIQAFLLNSAILQRMCAPLCDALMGSEGSQAVLDELESANLFLVPLDDKGYWFRYHHLFRDLLLKRSTQIDPDQVKELHRRAAVWFEEAGLFDEAIPHALDGEEFDRAAALMERMAREIIKLNKEKGFTRWLNRLPQEKIRQWPWLSISRARSGKAVAEESLHWAEESLALISSGEEEGSGAHYSEAEKERLQAEIAISRTHKALIDGDISRAVVEAEKALALLPAEDPSSARLLLALGGIYWAKGDRLAAEKGYAEAVAAGRKTGNRQFVTTSLCYLGLQQMKLGRLHAAHESYQEGLASAMRPDGTQMPIVAFPLIRLGEVLREWNELATAEVHLTQGFNLAFVSGYHDAILDAHINMARLHIAFNQWDEAMKLVVEAEHLLEQAPPDPYLIGWADECRVRIWLANGELDAAVHWMEKRGLTVDDALSYHHDLHHINLARVLVAQGVQDPSDSYLQDAQKLLERLRSAAEKADWVHETIKILILQALAFWVSDNQEESAESLTKALILAEPGGYVRIFIDEGRPMRQLLQVIDQAKPSGYTARLLAFMDNSDQPVAGSRQLLADPLTERELEVLRLLDSQLSNTKIASQLFISPNTVRFHMKNIYDKLDVHSRSEAVEKAHTLNLL